MKTINPAARPITQVGWAAPLGSDSGSIERRGVSRGGPSSFSLCITRVRCARLSLSGAFQRGASFLSFGEAIVQRACVRTRNKQEVCWSLQGATLCCFSLVLWLVQAILFPICQVRVGADNGIGATLKGLCAPLAKSVLDWGAADIA